MKKQDLEKLVQELSPRDRGDLGVRPAPKHPQIQILVLRLPGELQSYFCFPAGERMMQEEEDLEGDPFAVEVPFVGEDDAD